MLRAWFVGSSPKSWCCIAMWFLSEVRGLDGASFQSPVRLPKPDPAGRIVWPDKGVAAVAASAAGVAIVLALQLSLSNDLGESEVESSGEDSEGDASVDDDAAVVAVLLDDGVVCFVVVLCFLVGVVVVKRSNWAGLAVGAVATNSTGLLCLWERASLWSGPSLSPLSLRVGGTHGPAGACMGGGMVDGAAAATAAAVVVVVVATAAAAGASPPAV